MPTIILASSSPWRRALLTRLQLPHEALSPDIDETARADETPADLVTRLAQAKAEAIAVSRPDAIVIGSDQVADLDGAILGKPGTLPRAKQQLRRQSGREVVFRTGICVCAPGAVPDVSATNVTTSFRALTDAEIARYVEAEDVTGTAGSLKSEGLGITLVDAIDSDDPSALVGLPLITLRAMLARAGVALP